MYRNKKNRFYLLFLNDKVIDLSYEKISHASPNSVYEIPLIILRFLGLAMVLPSSGHFMSRPSHVSLSPRFAILTDQGV